MTGLTSAVSLAIAMAALAGCFDPQFRDGIGCGPGASCPSGMMCGGDDVCRTTSAAPGDGSVGDDAPRVECSRDADCARPPTRCLLAGTCNLSAGLCDFPSVDCSALDAECLRGVCQPGDGTCAAEADDEGQACGAGTSCDSFGACDFASVCDESAIQSRNCVDNVCRAGACAVENREELLPCQRDTDGLACGSAVPSGCGTCNTDCLRDCTCMTPTCASGSCSGSSTDPCVIGCPPPCFPE